MRVKGGLLSLNPPIKVKADKQGLRNTEQAIRMRAYHVNHGPLPGLQSGGSREFSELAL